MQLDDVRTALATRAGHVPAGAHDPHEVLERARRTVRRRRVGRAVVGVAAVLVIAVVAVAIAGAQGSPKRVVVSASSTTTALGAARLTAEQLAAHTGAGVPAGWVPVDAGEARVFVPAVWNLSSQGGCFGGAMSGIVSVGVMPMAGCSPADQYPVPENAVAIIPTSVPPPAAEQPTMVHGYRVFLAEKGGLLWSVHVVPELGVKIEARGDLQEKILATLAPSARKVALESAEDATPAGQAYAGDGLKMTIPSSWTVTLPPGYPCYGFRDYPGAPELERIRPGIAVPSCPALFPTAATAVGDGMFLFTSAGAFAPEPGRTPIAVLRHAETTIRVFAGSSYPNTLDLFVQRAGSSTVHVLTLGLGRDGRVAGGVLSSIEATS